jgi:peptidoglycan hydrolase-like protein with peptidoglycan-binding domain
MTRKLFGIGSHGGIVGDIQRGLVSAGCNPGPIDEIYGQGTVGAVKLVQLNHGLAVTGDVDDVTWGGFMPRPIPTLFERSLELTAAFEGHSYTLAVGDFDGAWLTWGIVGFTMKFGKVQAIIAKTNQVHPELIQQAFGDAADTLMQIMGSTPDQQKTWADSISINGRLAAPWRQQFQTLGEFEEVRAIQRQIAHDDYYVPCLTTARAFGLQSGLGVALCFDIHVQNGSINSTARSLIQKQLSGNPNPTEAALRQIIANAVADAGIPAFREDVRSRKIAIATGTGSVHGASYDLSNWGLGEFPAEDAALTHSPAA